MCIFMETIILTDFYITLRWVILGASLDTDLDSELVLTFNSGPIALVLKEVYFYDDDDNTNILY